MAISDRHEGTRVAAAASVLHEGPGRLLGYLISHNQAAAQAVIFYDNNVAAGLIVHQVYVSPERSPVFIQFEGKRAGIPFSTGLSVDPGLCDVAVWSIGY